MSPIHRNVKQIHQTPERLNRNSETVSGARFPGKPRSLGMALSTLSEVPPVEHSVAAASLSSTDAAHLLVARGP
jgi:hypothetical protein